MSTWGNHHWNWNWRILFETLIFRFHAKLGEGYLTREKWKKMKKKKKHKKTTARGCFEQRNLKKRRKNTTTPQSPSKKTGDSSWFLKIFHGDLEWRPTTWNSACWLQLTEDPRICLKRNNVQPYLKKKTTFKSKRHTITCWLNLQLMFKRNHENIWILYMRIINTFRVIRAYSLIVGIAFFSRYVI